MKGITSYVLLVLGLTAVSASSLTGCGGAVASDAQAAGSFESNSDGQGTRSFFIPLRISRVFFENQLTARVVAFEAPGQVKQEVPSTVRWYEGAPEGPEPQPGYIADFRDRPGCAVLEDLSASGQPSEVCFNIVPDVDAVDLTSEKVRFQYVGQALDQSCEGSAQTVQLKDAKKVSDDQIQLNFEINSGANCPVKQVTVELSTS